MAPLFFGFLHPRWNENDYKAADSLKQVTRRVLVEVRIDKGPWQPIPVFALDGDAKKPLPGWTHTALQHVTHIRIVLPVPPQASYRSGGDAPGRAKPARVTGPWVWFMGYPKSHIQRCRRASLPHEKRNRLQEITQSVWSLKGSCDRNRVCRLRLRNYRSLVREGDGQCLKCRIPVKTMAIP